MKLAYVKGVSVEGLSLLVMHLSSSVPQELQDIIKRYGGNIPADLWRAGLSFFAVRWRTTEA